MAKKANNVFNKRRFISFFTVLLILFVDNGNAYGQWNFDSTKVSRDTYEIISKIESINKLKLYHVSDNGDTIQQFSNFIELKQNATKEELVELTKHKNPVIRCYSFWALSEIDSLNLFPTVLSHLSDTESIVVQMGCFPALIYVGDFFLNVTSPLHNYKESKKITNEQRQLIDKILSYSPNELQASNDIKNKLK